MDSVGLNYFCALIVEVFIAWLKHTYTQLALYGKTAFIQIRDL